MTADDRPPIKLSVLRDIGWKEWDPIGLLAIGEAWDHQPFADEYDRYLLAVAGDLRRGGSLANAVQFLLRAVRETMGISAHPDQEVRASTTARLIQRYMTELDGRPATSD